MPGLVPAWSHEELKKKISKTRFGTGTGTEAEHLFDKMRIAGLVPGSVTSELDASAYLWQCDGEDLSKCAPSLVWTFEFKCRSGSYSLTEATNALEAKCKAFTDNHEKDNPKFHSMLVAITGNMKSECCIWLQDEKFRIVLLVGNGLRIPK